MVPDSYFESCLQAFVEILEEEDIQIPSWLVFNSKDGLNVVNGDSFDECIALAANSKKVVAVGINCTPPRFIDGMIRAARKVKSHCWWEAKNAHICILLNSIWM